MNYQIKNIKDFDAYKLADDIKTKHGLQACNNYKRCMLEFRTQSENSFLLSELDHAINKLIRIMITPDGTPTLFTLNADTGKIYKYMVNNHKWTRKHITIKDMMQYE